MATRPAAPLDQAALTQVLAPFGHSRMLPRQAYVDEGVLAWERQWFFDGGWVCAGRVDDLVHAGDQRAVQVGQASVLLVRGADGTLRAFANVCRHRGHELLACGAIAQRGVVQCPYHAWSYELDGRLRLAPRFDGAGNFEPANFGLLPVRAEAWGGWVFVNVSGDAPPLEAHLGTLIDLAAPYECDRLIPAAGHAYTLAANWKLPHENYQECYHCPLIHPELCRVSPPLSGDNYEHRTGAWVGGTMDLADGAETMSLDGRSGGRPLRGLSAEQRRQVVYVGLFPNLLLSFHPDYVMSHRMEPLSTGETFVECQWLFPPEAVEQPGFDPSYAVDFWDLTNRQDWAAVESVQRSLRSLAFVPGVLAEQEDAVYQFVTMVARGYLGELPSPQWSRPPEEAHP
jgi:Rieske 2Fe-2S family protein